MNEYGTSFERFRSGIGLQGTLDRFPGPLRQRIDRCAEAEQIEQDRLAVGAVVIGYKTFLGPPAVRQDTLIG